MKNQLKLAVLLSVFLASSPVMAQDRTVSSQYEKAVSLYEKGMYDRARAILESLPDSENDVMASGYSVLCSTHLQTEGYESLIDAYQKKFPGSALLNQICYSHANNLFEKGYYSEAADLYYKVIEKDLYHSQITPYLFKKAYSDFALGRYDQALSGFTKVEAKPQSDFLAPSRYALGYINYDKKNFKEAEKWFRLSARDSRFKEMSQYYLLECRFMQEDYSYVVNNAPQMMESCPQDRKERLARIISESYLVMGDTENAHRYFSAVSSDAPKTRSDLFYAGSLLYAIGDYEGAIRNYSLMKERTDSLGQIANYQMAYSYIKTKNKVDAVNAFKEAASVSFDPVIAEDAFFNYAKLSFDLNDDSSVFLAYIDKYSDKDKGPLIYNYMAVSALRSRKYAEAIENYDKIEELDDEMTMNYMKANYLLATQLIEDKAYRKAINHLKTAAYFSEKRSGFNQLTRYYLAESYFRNADYALAKDGFMDLYNTSALYGMQESLLLSYHIAYCCFMQEDYKEAERWFGTYLSGKNTTFRKEAMLRQADSYFIMQDYKSSSAAYQKVVDEYFNVNEIYPYYQCALSYGLAGNDRKKVEILENVEGADHKARFYQDAKFELGRAYVKTKNISKAVACFTSLAEDQGTESSFVARSLIELGMISHNKSDDASALKYYKRVVEELPMSEYVDDALLAIESIYQSKNDPEQYFAYIESIGKGAIKSDDERELMVFNAAEQIFISGNYQKALVSLENYIEKYPSGSRLSNAEFYIAESYRHLGQKEQACDYYTKVISSGKGSFVELSRLHFAEISYSLHEYDEAFSAYSDLYDTAVIDANKFVALKGMMNSSYAAKDFHRSVKYAQQVASDRRSDDDLILRARYIEAKSYLGISDRTRAFKILEELAYDPKSAEGAEATYLIIQDCYDRADFAATEEKVYAFSEAGTPHVYYLAKSFIVLGDSFAERGELEQAKATFESVRDGYTPAKGGDDVLEEVKVRLDRLEQMLNVPKAE